MKVNVSILRPRNPYEFAGIVLSYGSPEVTEVSLHIDYRNLFEFTRRQDGTAFDLFLVASIVYGIDILLPRETMGFDGWSREIEICFPVDQIDEFNNGKDALEKTLCFLTGDLWTISFESRTVRRLYKFGSRQKAYNDAFRRGIKW